MDLNREIEEILLKPGSASGEVTVGGGIVADVVGFADVSNVVSGDISHMKRAISIGLNKKLTLDTIKALEALQKEVALFLKRNGFKYLSIPPDSDRKKDRFISRLYPLFTHKIAATCAGLGWIGRNGLFISPVFGPKISLGTVLTDAPLRPGSPITRSLCNHCDLCVRYCPAGAISGKDWSVEDPYATFVDVEKCNSYRKKMREIENKPNCGLCINICPYGRGRGNTVGTPSVTSPLTVTSPLKGEVGDV